MKRNFYSAGKVRNENTIKCTFDTETEGLGGKILCCSFATPLGVDIFIGPDSAIRWINEILFQFPYPCIHYAHFAEYDWRYIIPYLLEHKDEYDDLQFQMRTERNIYAITIKVGKHKYVMRDSYAIYSASLREFAKQFNATKQKLYIDFENTQFNPQNPEHIEYAKRDAEVLKECIENYERNVKMLFDVSLGNTVAGTAVKSWQHTLPKDLLIAYSEDGAIEKKIRDAYYGGIVFLTSDKPHFNCKTFDINSSYPYCMITYPMPYGSPTQVSEYVPGKMGIYNVEIKTPPDMIVPILPCRNSRNFMQWRKGQFTTSITNFELEFALTHGCELVNLNYGMTWEETINPFQDFVNLCMSIRKQHKGTSYETIAKLMQNSLYGKFGSKRIRNKIVVGSENLGFEDAEYLSEEWDEVFIVHEYSQDMPCKPEWAVFITAFARLRIISTAYKIGIENVLYGDTDSLTVKSSADTSLIDVGSEYGQFKLEKEWQSFRVIAPKTYCGQLKSGKWIGAGKGLKKKKMTEEKYTELYATGKTEVEFDTLPSLTVALKKGIAPATSMSRKSSQLTNSQNYALTNGELELKYSHG